MAKDNKITEEDPSPVSTSEDDSSTASAKNGSPAIPVEDNPSEGPEESRRKRTILMVFGILCLVGGALRIFDIFDTIVILVSEFQQGFLTSGDAVTQVLTMVSALCTALTVMGFIILGIRLIQKKHRGARYTANTLIVLLVLNFLCSLMIKGIDLGLISYIIGIVVLIALVTYLNPELSQERRLQRKLRKMETREEAEEGTLGRDLTGRGYIKLDFFNLFWVFVLACIIGDLFETVYHMIVIQPGVYQDRAGLLFGPFSPIYGFGAVFMTIALNRFHNKNFVIIFLVSAAIGGAFEYLVSWFLQFAFGITAWNYTGTFLSIGGRTNFMFMCIWGVLGIVWIKLLLPLMLRIVNLIPWKWRYTVTTICAALMLADALMTLIALDCWYSRLAGINPDTAVSEFCSKYFDNDWMSHRFQSMTIDPSSSTRTSS